MIHAIGTKKPRIGKGVFVAWNAEVSGDVELSDKCSVWFSATIRADVSRISIGRATNVQDGAVFHVDRDKPCIVGECVTIGHGAIVHACTIGDACLIGMGAIVLDGASIGSESIVGAGALVTQNKNFPPRSLIVGSPAKVVRTLTEDEAKELREHAEHYATLGHEAAIDYRELEG